MSSLNNRILSVWNLEVHIKLLTSLVLLRCLSWAGRWLSSSCLMQSFFCALAPCWLFLFLQRHQSYWITDLFQQLHFNLIISWNTYLQIQLYSEVIGVETSSMDFGGSQFSSSSLPTIQLSSQSHPNLCQWLIWLPSLWAFPKCHTSRIYIRRLTDWHLTFSNINQIFINLI